MAHRHFSGLFLRTAIPVAMAMILAFPGTPPWARETRLGLAVLTTGTWATYGTLDGFSPTLYAGDLERYEFNKLALGLYGTVLGQPAYLSLPWQWTSIRSSGGSRDRIALGDGEIHLGQRLGKAEARVGLLFPAGYDGADGNPWIGPGNVQATLGLAVNPNITRYSKRWELSAETKAEYALANGLSKAGSWGVYPSAKLSLRLSETWKTGLETLGYWKSSYWGRSASFGQSVLGWKGPRAEWNAGLVPILFGECYPTRRFALGLKVGHSLWGYRDAASYNASAYVLYFP